MTAPNGLWWQSEDEARAEYVLGVIEDRHDREEDARQRAGCGEDL